VPVLFCSSLLIGPICSVFHGIRALSVLLASQKNTNLNCATYAVHENEGAIISACCHEFFHDHISGFFKAYAIGMVL
jgi:hypothetical protein